MLTLNMLNIFSIGISDLFIMKITSYEMIDIILYNMVFSTVVYANLFLIYIIIHTNIYVCIQTWYFAYKTEFIIWIDLSRTTVSQDVQTWFSVQLPFAKFLSKIKGNFKFGPSIMDAAFPQKFPFILNRNLAKANCTENRVCTSCDTVVQLGLVNRGT